MDEAKQELNLLNDAARIAGLTLMSMGITLAVGLAMWVLWNRKSPVVLAMQPLFLLVLIVGSICSFLTIIPLGMDDSNSSNPGSACMAHSWLAAIGVTFELSALFSKLWRVNQIFHAGGFQRKVVKVRDVLWPFAILLSISVVTLIVQNIVDPFVWVRKPIDGDENNTVGYCVSEGPGYALEVVRSFVNTVALIILCVQAYRARDIRSEFSEARGAALALFGWLQATIIAQPLRNMLEESNTKARYTLAVLYTTSVTISLLLFIFCPIVSHERKARRGEGGMKPNVRVTGLVDSGIREDGDVEATQSRNTSGETPELKAAFNTIADLESQLQSVQSRNKQLEETLKKREKAIDDDGDVGIDVERPI